MRAAGRLALLGTLLFAGTGLQAADAPGKLWVYVGTYTQGTKSKGIYRYDLDLATGKLSNEAAAGRAVNPSFLAIAPNHMFLYAVDEIADFKGAKAGAVTAFAIDQTTGNLARLNQQTTGGAGPCHLSVDKTGTHVLVANYAGGSVSVIPIGPDGKLGEPSAFIQHTGTVFDKVRQGGPHAHSINLDAANRFAVVADLGLDKLFVYRYDADKGTLTPNDPPALATAPRAGPRHFAFHPDGRHAYVINEIDCTLSALDYDAGRGVLTTRQTLSTLPHPVKDNSTAEVVVHPGGKFVYGSNRGYNSIAIYAVGGEPVQKAKGRKLRKRGRGGNAVSNAITVAGNQQLPVKTPRNFAIDPTGRWLLAAGQDSGNIVVCAVNPDTGALTLTGTEVHVPAPVCVRFMAPPTGP